MVVGSNPTFAFGQISSLGRAFKNVSCFIVGGLCNGSTTDFDSVSLGSIPSPPAKFYRYSIMDNTLRYERGDCGSIPYGGTKFKELLIK